MASIKKNVIYSSILSISGYLFPLLTFPYVTRVLGVDHMGAYNFIDSTISYFCIFAMMGINTVGIREVAKTKDNPVELSNTYSNLLVINLLFTFFSIALLIVLTILIPRFHEHQGMMYIGIGRILFNSLLIEWLYKGLEDFKYITDRSIIIKCIYVISVFLFVKTSNDYKIYFLLNVATFLVNAIVNLVYSRRFVTFSFKGLSLRSYISPVLVLGLYQILTAMYISFNVTFLGIVTNDVEVGYYSTATKVYAIIISLFSAFTGVMLPRLSSIVSDNNYDEFRRLTNKSIDALLVFVMPLIVIVELYAPAIVRILAGNGYEGAVIPMRIVIPLMLLVGYEQIIIIQMLSPLKKDKAILINSLVGATIALLLNILLVPKFASIGSSIVWVASEIAVTISAQHFVNKYVGFKLPYKRFLIRIAAVIPIILVGLFLNHLIHNEYIAMLIGSFVVFSYYVILEYRILKNGLVISIIDLIKAKCVKQYQ